VTPPNFQSQRLGGGGSGLARPPAWEAPEAAPALLEEAASLAFRTAACCVLVRSVLQARQRGGEGYSEPAPVRCTEEGPVLSSPANASPQHKVAQEGQQQAYGDARWYAPCLCAAMPEPHHGLGKTPSTPAGGEMSCCSFTT
jgi:hypothetical protein